jgi:hypothetical protein
LDELAVSADFQLRSSLNGYIRHTPRQEEDVLPLAIVLIIIGIVLAVLVNYALGIIVILIGLALLLIPYLRGGTTRRV